MIEGINWTTVCVSLASGLAGASGPVILWYMQARKERASVKASLLAEVSALLEMVARRHYVAQLRGIERDLAHHALLGDLESLDKADYHFRLPNGENYNRVYQANVSRLGALSPSDATLIVRFHQLADSVRADTLHEGMLAMGSINHEAWAETAGILESAIEIGIQLTTRSSSGWWLKKSKKK